MIDKTIKYRVLTRYVIDAEGKLWAYEIVPTRGDEYVAKSTNRFSTKTAAHVAGLEKLEELGLSRDMRGTGSKSSVGRKPADEKMQQTTVYAPQSLLELAAAAGLNKSQIFTKALAKALIDPRGREYAALKQSKGKTKQNAIDNLLSEAD